jgi:hypothetical protein
MYRPRRESHYGQNGSNDRKQKQQGAFGISCGNKKWDELAKDPNENEPTSQQQKYVAALVKPRQGERRKQNGDNKEQDLNCGSDGEAEAGTIFEHLFQESFAN